MISRDILFPAPNEVVLVDREVGAADAHEVLCEARQSLLSTGTESFCLAGEFDAGTFWEEWVQFPFAPGYSMVSTVLEVGPSVTGIAVGDRVATSTPHAQFFIVDESEVVVVPDDITDEQAVWTSLACTTQLGIRRAEIGFGDTVGVVGLGLLGQLVIQYLAIAGAGRIVGIDTSPQRLTLARASGATDLVAGTAAESRPELETLTGGRLLDTVFDITGHPAVLADATTLVRPRGTVLLLGDSPRPSAQHLGPRVVADSLSIIGVHASSAPATATLGDPWTLRAMTELFFQFLRDGRMDVGPLISHRIRPDDAPAIYRALKTDRSSYLGVIFDWTREKGQR